MLHPVNSPKGRVKWCGPTALAALTGLSYEEAIDLLKAVRVRAGRRNPTVKGVQNGDMFLALLRMGYEAERIKVQTVGLTKKGEPQTETFAAFLSRRSGHLRDAPILVNVTRHYLAVEGAWGIESRTEGNAPISVMELGSRRARMEHAWEIVRTRRVDAKAVIAEARSQIARTPAVDACSEREMQDLRMDCRRKGLAISFFERRNGCVITRADGRPFHFGIKSIYRGYGWKGYAEEFILDFYPEDHDQAA